MSSKPTRTERSEATYDAAYRLASANGMSLTNPSDGCYQLRSAAGWIINMYPRRKGVSSRMYHDPHHRGPFLRLPENWTLLDAVKAAIDAMAERAVDESEVDGATVEQSCDRGGPFG